MLYYDVQPTFTEKVSFVERTFGKGILSRSGEDIAVSCPICKDSKKKKLSISLVTWSFHCWVCGEKGRTLVPILRKTNTRDVVSDYRQRFLNQKSFHEKEETKEEQLFEYPDEFVLLSELLESTNPNVRAVISYLKSRDLTTGDFYKYRAGMTPNGKDPRRVYFISLDSNGEENFFVSRSIDERSRQKYVNAKVDKTKIVFNECEIDWDSTVFIVEGVFDQIRLGKNCACLLGSTLSEESLLFRRLVENACEVVLCLDEDAQQKSRKIADMLIEYGCEVKMFPLRGSKDVGSMTKRQILESCENLSKWDRKFSLLSKINTIRSGTIL